MTTTQVETRACARCGCQTVQPEVWNANRGPVRDQWKADGWRRASGRGLCVTCYQYLRSHDRLDEFAPVSHFGDTVAKCSRCGIHSKLDRGLCVDCTIVLTDLGERDRWAS